MKPAADAKSKNLRGLVANCAHLYFPEHGFVNPIHAPLIRGRGPQGANISRQDLPVRIP